MKLTPLYQKHVDLGATMYVTGTGYAMPARYKSVDEEARQVRIAAGMIDLSLMGRLDIKGRDALELTQRLIVNNAARLTNGQALYSVMCNDRGLIVDDVVVFRFGKEHFRIITSSMYRSKTLAWISEHADGTDTCLTDVSSGLAMIGVQGPKSRKVLSAITDIDLAKLGFFRFVTGRLAGIQCTIARLGFSGELGYECYINTEDAMSAWEHIAEAGLAHRVIPYGMDTLDALRWEKGFIFFGYDVTEKENPYECGLWPFIKYDCGDFIGRDALLRLRDAGPLRKLMGLEVSGQVLLEPGKALHAGGRAVGIVVSGFHSFNLDRNLGYAYVDAPLFEPGVAVTTDVNGTEIHATVAQMPFFDPEGRRMHS
jgi:aminomethyltransferase